MLDSIASFEFANTTLFHSIIFIATANIHTFFKKNDEFPWGLFPKKSKEQKVQITVPLKEIPAAPTPMTVQRDTGLWRWTGSLERVKRKSSDPPRGGTGWGRGHGKDREGNESKWARAGTYSPSQPPAPFTPPPEKHLSHHMTRHRRPTHHKCLSRLHPQPNLRPRWAPLPPPCRNQCR